VRGILIGPCSQKEYKLLHKSQGFLTEATSR